MMILRRAGRAVLRWSVGLSALLMTMAAARADEVYLEDGSHLVGEIIAIEAEILRFETAFAGRIDIEKQAVKGMISDQPHALLLDDDQALLGRLHYTPDSGQTVAPAAGESIAIQLKAISRLGPAGSTISDLQTAEQPSAGPASGPQATWTARIEGGISGASGNADRFALQGRAEADRESEINRLNLYLQGNLAREDGEGTQSEVRAGGRYERDFSEHWFAFGSADLERDKFEDLDLRSVLSAGAGYFIIRRQTQTWKARAGLGWRNELFTDGTSQSEIILNLGWDYDIALNNWLAFTHKFNYLPALSDFIDDFRIESDARMRIPVSNGKKWTVGLGVRNQYDNQPQADVEKLDTTYSVTFGRSFP